MWFSGSTLSLANKKANNKTNYNNPEKEEVI